MANQTITINRKKYAVGLVWQPIGAGFNARNYARTLSHNINRHLNLYTEYRAMIGLGARRDIILVQRIMSQAASLSSG